jgi:spore germination protein YaaH
MKKTLKISLLLALLVPVYTLIPVGNKNAPGESTLFSFFMASAIGQTPEKENLSQKVWEYIWGEGKKKSKQVKVPNVIGDGKSPISRYDQLYNYLQGNAKANFDSLQKAGTIRWDSVEQIFLQMNSSGEQVFLDSTVIFGWHPFWMGNTYKNYQFNLLSHVSFYAYVIDPGTGNPANDSILQQWIASDFMSTAKADNSTKVLLTVVNYGTQNNKSFLSDGLEQQSRLIEKLLKILEETGADGIDLNFEGIAREDAPKFTAFVRRLRENLKTQDQRYMLSVSLSGPDRDMLELGKLQDLTDFIVLMGYELQQKDNQSPGPIAPLYSGGVDLDKLVEGFLKAGMNKKNLVLALPYYGAQWKTLDTLVLFDQYMTYRQIKSRYGKENPQYTAPDSLDAFYKVTIDSVRYEVWFDDQVTLRKKFDYARNLGLKGVGMWALGYDDGHLDFWQLIQSEYTISYSAMAPPAKSLANKIAAFTLKYKELLITAYLYLLCFLVLGLMISLNYSNVREAFFQSDTYRVLFVLSTFTIMVLLYFLIVNEPGYSIWRDSSFMLILGLGLGLLITNVIYYLYNRWKKSLPQTNSEADWHKNI